jgi:aspartyl/asparaginyl beta-hydroxylase (cupin superfamily)
MAELPQARSIIFGLMRQVEGERLGPVMITRLAHGKRIYPHDDGAAHTSYYKRYHIALHSAPGVKFRAGNEEVNMMTGEVWWFDNSVEHEVVNNSYQDRLSLIVDIRPCT